MFDSEWLDNSTLKGEIFEGLLQTIFWAIALNQIEIYLRNYCEGKKFYKHISKQKGGTQEFISGGRCIPQHLVSGLIAFGGCVLNSPRLTRHGSLAEFGYELFDICRVFTLYFQGEFDPSEANKFVIATTLHHLPGILVIIPANLYLSNDYYFQSMVASLLLPASFTLTFHSLLKTYDLNNLIHRTQFTVVYVLNLALFFGQRLMLFNYYCYMMVYESWNDWSLSIRCFTVFYFVLLSGFNFLVEFILIERLIHYMTAKNEEEVMERVTLLRATSNDIFTQSIESNFLSEILDYNKKRESRARITKLPFRTMVSEPLFKFE